MVSKQGELEHAYNKGNRGVIGPGDVQWMTAGKGIIHEEFHSTEFAKTGGVLEMCQLWVNLPAAKKMSKPRYQPILADTIKSASLVSSQCTATATTADAVVVDTSSDGSVRIIAGAYRGVTGPATTVTPMDMLDVSINTTTKSYDFEFPESYNVIVFVRDGSLEVGDRRLGAQDVAVMNRSGTVLSIKATSPKTKVLILAGEPLNEPIVQHGPMCMNSKEEIKQAMIDYQMGKF